MGQSARIIEFNGLAGCGKTTLARALKEELTKSGFRVVLFGEAYHIFKEHLVQNIIKCFRWRLFFQYIMLFSIIGRKKENTVHIYWVALTISIVYRWCLIDKKFDYILCDHGLIQNYVSLLGFEAIEDHDRFHRCLTSILKAESNVYLVNCNVPIELSCQRIRIRKKTIGRLDVIRDDLILEKLLRRTESHFFVIRHIVRTVPKEWTMIDLETDKPTSENVQKIFNLLVKRNEE